jgi:hypothetical protein
VEFVVLAIVYGGYAPEHRAVLSRQEALHARVRIEGMLPLVE